MVRQQRRQQLATETAEWASWLVDTYASWIRIAYDQRDYWQNRSLAQKLLSLVPNHPVTGQYLTRIEQRLGS